MVSSSSNRKQLLCDTANGSMVWGCICPCDSQAVCFCVCGQTQPRSFICSCTELLRVQEEQGSRAPSSPRLASIIQMRDNIHIPECQEDKRLIIECERGAWRKLDLQQILFVLVQGSLVPEGSRFSMWSWPIWQNTAMFWRQLCPIVRESPQMFPFWKSAQWKWHTFLST